MWGAQRHGRRAPLQYDKAAPMPSAGAAGPLADLLGHAAALRRADTWLRDSQNWLAGQPIG
jgi:hypothetical protein